MIRLCFRSYYLRYLLQLPSGELLVATGDFSRNAQYILDKNVTVQTQTFNATAPPRDESIHDGPLSPEGSVLNTKNLFLIRYKKTETSF